MRRSGATIRYGAGRLLVGSGALAAAWSLVTVLSGGFLLHAGPLAISSRDPFRPLIAAVILLAVARLLLPGVEFGRALQAIVGDRERRAARLAIAVSGAVLVVSIAWNTRAAGGSDSSCYVLQAEAFARGEITLTHPLSSLLPDATPAMFAPTGFVPSRMVPLAAVPICGPGLALVMAAVSPAGPEAAFFVVPVFAALAVWLTFLLGRRLDDEVTGTCAAVLLATSPIFLYQSVQPMSDVPAAALWLAALVAVARGDARGQIAAGVCASAAVLMRPNVALIVLPLAALLPDRRAWVRFGLAAAPGLVVLAWLNAARYGSPLSSGYGGTGTLFSFAHVGPNLARYPRWLLVTETPFVAAALLAPLWARRHRARSTLVLASLAAVVLTFATYLAYTVFDDWWYIRFLLPALPVLIVLSVVVTLSAVSRLPRAAVAGVLCLGIGAWHLNVAHARQVFELQVLESRFRIAGRYAARALPSSAVVLAVQQSGSIRFYGARATIAWDAIPPDALDATIERLRAAGRPPFLALEDIEEPRFRARFQSERFGQLDWPPIAEIHAPGRVRFFDPAAREAYLRGATRPIEHVR